MFGGGKGMLIFLETIENEEDRSKVRQIYENYVSLMRCKANEILGNRHDADDAVQNAFVRIIDHLEDLPSPNCTQTKWYVVTAATNAAIDIWRKRKRDSEVLYDDAFMSGDSRDPYQGDNEIIREMLKLSSRDQQLLYYRHVYGYKNAEIAELLNMTEEAVKKAVRRAEERLGEKCREDGII
jgi:RNA polymerase sigma-70 factor (ECF subfamily)